MKENYAYLLMTNNESKQIKPKNGECFRLEEMQKMVDGYIEIVRLNDEKILVVNEEGLLNGLPLNIFASSVAGRMIVGNAILCHSSMVR